MHVYSLGSNGSGQLGLGHTEDISTPTLLNLASELRHSAISAIRAGGNHTLISTRSSEIYSTGDNSNGRCALNISQSTSLNLSIITATKLCAAAWEASVFVSADHSSVWSCGTGLKGELGLGPRIASVASPTRVPDFPPVNTKIVDLAACMGHVAVVLSNGEIWGWGNGQQGQLGEPAQIVWEPRKIGDLSFKCVRVVCGKDFTGVFGDPDEGRLAIIGLKKRDRFGVSANAPETVSGWKDVQATWGSVYVLRQDGTLFGWGRNDHGQLPPTDLPKIKSVAAGSEHVVALSAEGEVLAWGWGEHGNCGEPVDEQKDVKGRWNTFGFDGNAIAVGAGCATSWIITEAAT